MYFSERNIKTFFLRFLWITKAPALFSKIEKSKMGLVQATDSSVICKVGTRPILDHNIFGGNHYFPKVQ